MWCTYKLCSDYLGNVGIIGTSIPVSNHNIVYFYRINYSRYKHCTIKYWKTEETTEMYYLLPSRELEFCTTQSLDNVFLVSFPASHRNKDLTNVNTSHGALGFAKSTTHPSLKPEIVLEKMQNHKQCIFNIIFYT